MPQRKQRRVHTVRATLAVRELSNAGSSLNLRLYASKRKIGELIIGRGSLYWFGRNRHMSKRIKWSQFAEMMDHLAYEN
jgi:hypothetical protein